MPGPGTGYVEIELKAILLLAAAGLLTSGCQSPQAELQYDYAVTPVAEKAALVNAASVHVRQVAAGRQDWIDLEVWVFPDTPTVNVVEVDVLLQWDARRVAMRGSIYRQGYAITPTSGYPPKWQATFPIRWAPTHANDTWNDGDSWVSIVGPVCKPWGLTNPVHLATVHMRWLNADTSPSEINIENRNYTRVVGPWTSDPCGRSDRTRSRVSCILVRM